MASGRRGERRGESRDTVASNGKERRGGKLGFRKKKKEKKKDVLENNNNYKL